MLFVQRLSLPYCLSYAWLDCFVRICVHRYSLAMTFGGDGRGRKEMETGGGVTEDHQITINFRIFAIIKPQPKAADKTTTLCPPPTSPTSGLLLL